MCGIVGSIGLKNNTEIVLNGLNRLEYRGYDSCGICYIDNNEIKINKSINRVQDLINKTKEESSVALGHTRWATHGKVTLNNAHPHLSSDNKIVLIHNGVIENYSELYNTYLQDITLQSETDSEILLELLSKFYNESSSMNYAIEKLIEVTQGSYALIIYNKDEENKLYAVKNKSPLLIGKNENIFTLSSDPSAVIDQTDMFYQFNDKTYAVISPEETNVYDHEGIELNVKFEKIVIDFEIPSTKEYDTFMHKEIEEQPHVLRNIIDFYKNHDFDESLLKTVKDAKKIYIIASGTSYHAGLICKRLFIKKLRIPTSVEIGSEFGYSDPIIEEGSVFVFLSQSGETADSMLVFNKIKGKYPIISITNTRGSQMDRNSDFSLLLYAGSEVSVASTKAYTSQIAVTSILIYTVLNDLSIYDNLEKLIIAQYNIINDQKVFEEIANDLKNEKQIFYLGRLNDYYQAMEASLKLKEITYINVSAFPSGELKHGTISLIEEDTKVINIITDPTINNNSRSNNDEVKARGAITYTFSTSQICREDDTYVVDYDGDYDLIAIASIIPHQFIAYFTTKLLNHDVDKPRNLAKSVTVE